MKIKVIAPIISDTFMDEMKKNLLDFPILKQPLM